MPPTRTNSIVVANVTTLEPFCDKVEVECWPVQASGAGAPTGTIVAGPLFASMVPTANVFRQANPIFFEGLTIGTQYSFRSRITLKGGGSPSAWSVWATETAGDTSAPTTSYVYAAALTAAGATLWITPSGSPSDHDHFELYCAQVSGSPPVSAQATEPNFSTDGPFFISISPTAVVYVSIRDVDTSGNRQSWVQLGSFTSGTLEYSTDGSSRRAMLTANTDYRPTSNPLTATDTGSGYPQAIVAAHAYNIPSVTGYNVSGGSVNGTSGDFGKTAYIYFDDPNLLGGLVSYQMTFTRENVLSSGGRVFVGSVSLPAQSGPNTVGNDDGGGGATYTRRCRLNPSYYSASGWTNPANAIDENDDNFASGSAATGASRIYIASGFPAFYSWFTSIDLVVKHEFNGIASGTTGVIDYSTDGGVNWTVARAVTGADGGAVTTTVALTGAVKTDKVAARMKMDGAGVSLVSAYPASAVNDATVGLTDWTNPSAATGTVDGFGATCSNSVPGSQVDTHYLKLNRLGLSLPSGATPAGVKATFRRKATYSAGTGNSDEKFTIDDFVQLCVNNAPTGTDHADTVNPWPSVLTDKDYGSSSDLWGLSSLTKAQVESTGFGFCVAAGIWKAINALGTNIATADGVLVTVYYAVSGGSGSSSGKLYAVSQVVKL